MSSKSESGHAKNVSNFETLISFVVGFGEKYKPLKQIAKLPNMQAMLIEANAVLATMSQEETRYFKTVNQRAGVFRPLGKLSTRVLAIFSEVATDADLEDAQAHNRKIQGSRAIPKEKPKDKPEGEGNAEGGETEETHNYISVSQRSFDNLVIHYGRLLDKVKANAEYVPDEPDLKLSALTALLAELREANSAVKTAASSFKNAMNARNALLYKPKVGLTAAAASSKKHVMGVYGHGSAEHRLVSGLAFVKPRD